MSNETHETERSRNIWHRTYQQIHDLSVDTVRHIDIHFWIEGDIAPFDPAIAWVHRWTQSVHDSTELICPRSRKQHVVGGHSYSLDDSR